MTEPVQKMHVRVLDRIQISGIGWCLKLQSISPGDIYVGDTYTTPNDVLITIMGLEIQEHNLQQYTHPSCFWANIHAYSSDKPNLGDVLIQRTTQTTGHLQRMHVRILDKIKVGGVGWCLKLQSTSSGYIFTGDVYTSNNVLVTIKTLESQDHTDMGPNSYKHPACFWSHVYRCDIDMLNIGATLVPQ